uniref:GNAT family N-acetyltransferase n=1 Tax=Thaumasiovibrio occultus TaxID=1891184 RepID=UPI000B35D517|nr:GNAT family N-acetyltransferase [Thaumasiovibrio occultus]
MKWISKRFSELSTQELYALLKLRVDVFVVEQNCPYPELDGKDTLENVIHLLGYQDNELAAYLRVLGPGVSFDSVSLGRILLAPIARGGTSGTELVEKGIQLALNTDFGARQDRITISAQSALIPFYQRLGFHVISESYLEDDIPHTDMAFSCQDQKSQRE